METTILKYLAEDGVTWLPFTGDVPAPTASIVVKGSPIGAVDGVNNVFTTPQPYVGGTLQLYINGFAQSSRITENDPLTGEFSVSEAPLAGDDLAVYFHVANTSVGNADSLGNYQLSAILEALYPVGSKYDSGESDELPALIASIGTWERFKGRFVIGVDESDTSFNVFGEQGGEKTHTLTTEEMPSHRHSLGDIRTSEHNTGADTNWKTKSANSGSSAYSEYTGGGDAHNNMPPYEATYMWKRVA